jgi:hypothetical protein
VNCHCCQKVKKMNKIYIIFKITCSRYGTLNDFTAVTAFRAMRDARAYARKKNSARRSYRQKFIVKHVIVEESKDDE